jgi:hypothetical protein
VERNAVPPILHAMEHVFTGFNQRTGIVIVVAIGSWLIVIRRANNLKFNKKWRNRDYEHQRR